MSPPSAWMAGRMTSMTWLTLAVSMAGSATALPRDRDGAENARERATNGATHGGPLVFPGPVWEPEPDVAERVRPPGRLGRDPVRRGADRHLRRAAGSREPEGLAHRGAASRP